MRERQLEEENCSESYGDWLYEMFFLACQNKQIPKLGHFAKIVSGFKNSFVLNFY